MPISPDTTPTVDLTVTAQHTRGALPRDPEVMRAYLESGRATDAVKVSKLCFFFCLLCAAFFLDFFCVAFASALVLSGNIWTDGATRRHTPDRAHRVQKGHCVIPLPATIFMERYQQCAQRLLFTWHLFPLCVHLCLRAQRKVFLFVHPAVFSPRHA